MSDRLYLPPFDVGRAGEADTALGVPADAVVTFVQHDFAVRGVSAFGALRYSSLTADEARSLRDKLNEILKEVDRSVAPSAEDRSPKTPTAPAPEGLTDVDRERLIAALETYGTGGGSRSLLTGQAIAAAAMLRADARLRPEETTYLLAAEPCDTCGHREPLHDAENAECNVPACDCGLRRWKAEHERKGHTIVERSGGGTRGP